MLSTYVKPFLKWLAAQASHWKRHISPTRRSKWGSGGTLSGGSSTSGGGEGSPDVFPPDSDSFPIDEDRSKLLQEFVQDSDLSETLSRPVCELWPHSRLPLSYTAVLWTLLSILVSVLCTFSFAQPYWIAHPDLVTSFGLVGQCVRDVRWERPRPTCSAYGDSGALRGLPSGVWQAACVFFGSGCVMESLAALLCLLVLVVPEACAQRLAVFTGYVQTVAVLIMIAGLVLFPLGFGTALFRYYCGEAAGAYCSGHCQMGWGYMLAVMGTALSLFCPVLSSFVDIRSFSSHHEPLAASTV